MRHLEYYSRLVDWHSPPKASDDLDVRLLASAALYQQENTATPQVVRAAAECCTRMQRPWAKEVVESLLTVVPNLSRAERNTALTDASKLSLPPWLYRKLNRGAVPLRQYAHLLLERPDFLCVCVPPSFSSRESYIRELRKLDPTPLEAAKSNVAPLAVVIHARPSDVASLPGVRSRHVHVQDAAQQFGLSLLSPLAHGERVLDATAAPGGKTRCLLAHQPHARVLAVERNRVKAEKLREALRASAVAGSEAPAPSVHVIRADVGNPRSWWDGEQFGAVLLDPPCTSTGLLRTIPEVKVHCDPLVDLPALREIQLRLLRGVWPTLKPGGELLYTTCSLLDEENEKVVGAFLKETPDAAFVDISLSRPALGVSRGHANNRDDRAEDVSLAVKRPYGGVLFYPSSQNHNGAFVALLRKGT